MPRNFTPTGAPIFKSAGSSRVIRDELTAIGAGFAGVEAEIDLKANAANAALTGVPTAPTALQTTNTSQIATTAFVIGQAGTSTPIMDSVAAVGTSSYYARQDHVHPSDTTKLDVATAVSDYAPLNSPALTGNPTAPTATYGDNDTSIANTAFVQAAISGLIDAAPGTLDTLNEIAAALGDDPNFAATITTQLGLKAPLASPALTGAPTTPTAAADTTTAQIASTAFVIGQAGTSDPVQDDITAAVGTSKKYARADHRHPINPAVASAVETCTTKAAESSASASVAGGYATDALNAKNAAETALDSFDDRYLGAKAADPATDNDGNALLTGALYFNTGANEMKVYSGSAWVSAYVPSSTYATLTGEQTLTNKTIDASLNTLLNLPVGSTLFRSARSSNTILGADDNSKLIDITSGTFTQTFTAAATLGDGWYCYIRNSGTGDITLDPDGSETIDGLTSYIMYPGETRLVQCDGTAFYTVVLSAFYRVLTTTGTFVKPPGYTMFSGHLWSGGASGQRTNSGSTQSLGGGGGGCTPFTLPAGAFPDSLIVTVGAGGAAQTAVNAGNAGGTSSVGTVVYAYAGSSWARGGSPIFDAHDTSGLTYSDLSGTANNAGSGAYFGGGGPSSNASANAGVCWFGGAAGGSISSGGTIRNPGTSIYGGDGGAASSASNGSDGVVPGGGGGATQTGAQSGAGARGECRIWGVI